MKHNATREPYRMDIRSVVIAILIFSFLSYNAGLGTYHDITNAVTGTAASANEGQSITSSTPVEVKK